MITKDKKRQGRPGKTAAKAPKAADERRRAPADSRRNPRDPRGAAPQPERRPRPEAEMAAAQAERRPQRDPRATAQEERRPRKDPRAAAQEERRPGRDPRAAAQAERRPGRDPRAAASQEERRPRRDPRAAAQAERRPGRDPRAAFPRETHNSRPESMAAQSAPQNFENHEEHVYKMEQAPRQTPTAGRSGQRRQQAPGRQGSAVGQLPPRVGKDVDLKDAPQGTSYQRHTPKEKKLFGLFSMPKPKPPKDPEVEAEKARKRQQAREEKEKKKRKQAVRFDTPAIVYTQPKPFNRNRLLIQMVTVLTVACAFVMGLSIFFKVKVITVSGAETYSPWAIREASGITEGANLLSFGQSRASAQIKANLPYVDSVRIGIKLPDTVNIVVEELDVVYSIKSTNGDWWLLTSGGKIVEQIPGALAKNYTQVLGIQVDHPVPGEQAYAAEETPSETTETGDAPPVTVTGAQQLKTALDILQALEDNDIVGEAASVNVSNLQNIELWYGQRYQVSLGDNTQLDYKVACMYDAILQLNEYQTGMLDVSFTKKTDQVVYTPFV